MSLRYRASGPARPYALAVVVVASLACTSCAGRQRVQTGGSQAAPPVAGAVAAGAPVSPGAAPFSPGFSPRELARSWDAEHVSAPLPPLLRHGDVEAHLGELRRAASDLFSFETIGRSVEGRSLNHVWFGNGPLHVLLWSQMHGDEPTATSALFDVFEYVRRHRADPAVNALLSSLTVHAIPMLNPDGAERFERRNAQGIDINRDALRLQTPEGRALKALRDRLEPAIGFNLHNQNWRTTAGSTRKPASISLLAVAFDEARSDNPGRVRARKTCALIREALEPLAPGQIARYDDSFEVRAFGDNITRWGTSVVLIETGAYSLSDPDPALVRLNFVAILSALEGLATGAVERADPARYEALPMNSDLGLYHLLVNASVLNGAGTAPFIADIGIGASRIVRTVNGVRTLHLVRRIDDLGDLRVLSALETIDATGLYVAPLSDPAPAVGAEIRLPDEATPRQGMAPGSEGAAGRARVAAGQPADLLLLRPLGDNRYRVERVFRGDEAVGGRR